MPYGRPDRTNDHIRTWGGIATARVETWAEELECDPSDVRGRLEAVGKVIVDTAVAKNPNYDHERPDDPDVRCLSVQGFNGLLDD